MSDQPRVIDVHVAVPGTPERVWQAIATGPGISSWFVTHEVEERVGGSVAMDFGADYPTEHATVTAWEPPHRVVFETAGERALAFEWLVEARDGGSCVVRLVNSGFGPGEDWDADDDGMSAGWPMFLEKLRLHLTHFAGQRARPLIPTRMVAGTHDEVFSLLCKEIGVADDLTAGDRFRTGNGAPELAGTVQRALRSGSTSTYSLLLEEPAPGTAFVTAEGAGEQSAVSVYLYLCGEQGAAVDDAWTPLLAERFPAPTQ